MTRTTIAALAIVEAIDAGSIAKFVSFSVGGALALSGYIHIDTILPITSLPNVRYPVIATST